jgi:TusA-related sulfurtransferase
MHLHTCAGKPAGKPIIGVDMTAKITLDLKGVVSPMDLLKCSACLTAMETGDVLEAVLADVDVVKHLTMIILKSNDEILYQRQTPDGICIGIRKGPRRYDDVKDKG